MKTYLLDDKRQWDIGRPSKGTNPDIKLYSSTVSRKHGSFRNMDGVWFYLDCNGKNGTIYNGKHIEEGLKGQIKPMMLSDGDVFIFGGGEKPVINHKTVWAMYLSGYMEQVWRVVDTKGAKELSVKDGNQLIVTKNPEKGTVVRRERGMVIYMGDVTYVSGEINVI